MRWIGVLLMLGCGSDGGSGAKPIYAGWSGTIQSARVGTLDAGFFIRQDGDVFMGSYLAGVVGLTGAIDGRTIAGGYRFHLRPTACDGGFDGTAMLDGGVLEVSYSGASCIGKDTGHGTLPMEY